MILSLVNQLFAVPESMKIRDLTHELKTVPDVWAVGVVDEEGKPLGVIVASQFQERMSRPYAHDILDKKAVTEVMVQVPTFHHDKNIHSVAEELADEVRQTAVQYYVVKDSEGKFCGIFSTKDLLIHQFNAHLEDIDTAITIQQSVVPERTEVVTEGLELFTQSDMAKGVGGDFLSTRDLGDGRWLLSVCDVSGKGVAASLVTASLGGMFAQYDRVAGVPTFVSLVNQYILDTYKMEKYLTGVVAELDLTTKKITVCDMAHSYVGVVRQGVVLKSAPQNPFIGFVPHLTVHHETVELQKGDLLYMYTDGFPEQKNEKAEEFGVDAVEALLRDHAAEPLADLASRLHRTVKTFRGDQPRGDDEAVLLARIL